MARKPGHESCRTCQTCGLTDCPNCDTEGKSCPILHSDVEQRMAARLAKVHDLVDNGPYLLMEGRRYVEVDRLLLAIGTPRPATPR